MKPVFAMGRGRVEAGCDYMASSCVVYITAVLQVFFRRCQHDIVIAYVTQRTTCFGPQYWPSFGHLSVKKHVEEFNPLAPELFFF